MTEPQDLSPERVAELQKQLSDAAAQVAKVQAELGQATTTPAPESPEPVDTYSTTVFEPGQQPGQAVDLSAILGPAMAQQVRDQLGQLGLDQQVAGLLGALPAHVGPATPTTVDRISDPPRRVPLTFRLSSLWSWSWWEAFTVLMVAVAPIAVWGFFPWTIPGALIAGLLAIAVTRGRKYLLRVGLLKWGKVATVTNADEISRGTYYSGTTYNNMLVRQANGWDVTKRVYSGPASKTKVNYSLDDVDGTVTLRGLPFNNGVILADSRKPARALCVSSFPFSVKPDANGDFAGGGLSIWSWFGIYCTMLLHAALVLAAVYAVLELWLD
jgi:hypothetical protein